ncbi:hypothetical protein PYW08_013048 [Mythimna loreyi]|uniref:Uncharacterized protein n=1 Tax=Mythimna loreyi TaxID=667449 RepID=A0ACC2Q3Z9_9NEOP|nr:hypothetical protein PYW08_013048 [Mythimna loreyi]
MVDVAEQSTATGSPVKVSKTQTKTPVVVPKGTTRAGCEQDRNEEPSPDTQLTLREEIRLFRSELREVRDEMREFRREMAGLQSSVGVCVERVDSLEARIVALESKEKVALPDSTLSQLERTVVQLRLDLNDREQDLLGSDLEIANIPEIPGSRDFLNKMGNVALDVVLLRGCRKREILE